jgi:hypothetical protein
MNAWRKMTPDRIVSGDAAGRGPGWHEVERRTRDERGAGRHRLAKSGRESDAQQRQ